MTPFRASIYFINHYLQSRSYRAFHSPYLFSLFTYACNESISFQLFKAIESERKKFLESPDEIIRMDAGAGSVIMDNRKTQKISNIAVSSLSRPYQCRFMARMAHFITPRNVLEFGTSLGISAAYIASGTTEGRIKTVEGDPSIAQKANALFQKINTPHISLTVKTFESFISNDIEAGETFDLIFLDGNHKKDAVLKYYSALEAHVTERTIIIIDDIYWNSEMQSSWQELISKPRVTQSVNCFHFGLLFFRQDFLNKQNHIVRLPLRALF